MVRDTQSHVQWVLFPFRSTDPAKVVGRNLRIVADQLFYNDSCPERSVVTKLGVESKNCQFKPSQG